MGAVVGRRDPIGAALLGPAGSAGGADAQRAELVEGEYAVGEVVQDVLDPVELGVALGVGGLFQVLVRWKVTPRRASRQRRASRPIRITRPWTLRR